MAKGIRVGQRGSGQGWEGPGQATSIKALPPLQGSKLCLQQQPVTMTCTHTQFNVAWALCPPPTGWVVRALRGCSPSPSHREEGRMVPLRTGKGDLAGQK